MLAQKSYPAAYVAACRQTLHDQMAAYAGLGLTAAQRSDIEPGHARTLLLALDNLFTHRMRGQEGTGALQRVRRLCDDLREGLVSGGGPTLSVAEVEVLVDAFLDEILARFPEHVSA